MRAFERIGPEHYDDANCNKIIFAIHAMTFFRGVLGNVLTCDATHPCPCPCLPAARSLP